MFTKLESEYYSFDGLLYLKLLNYILGYSYYHIQWKNQYFEFPSNSINSFNDIVHTSFCGMAWILNFF